MFIAVCYGRRRFGKTRYLYETAIKQAVEQPDRLFLFVVPEQYTMQTQRNWCAFTPERA